MTFRHMHHDIQSEYLLLVLLAEPEFGCEDYRHIRATVVRRAVPHKMSLEGRVTDWADDYADRCFGYRIPSYVFSKTKGTYVDDMQLIGQIDVNPNYTPLNGGKPYGNKIEFAPSIVCQNTARAILDFFNKREKFLDKFGLASHGDDFYVQLNHLAQFLKITKVLFQKPEANGSNIHQPENFEEIDIAFAETRINEIVAPFARPV